MRTSGLGLLQQSINLKQKNRKKKTCIAHPGAVDKHVPVILKVKVRIYVGTWGLL